MLRATAFNALTVPDECIRQPAADPLV